MKITWVKVYLSYFKTPATCNLCRSYRLIKKCSDAVIHVHNCTLLKLPSFSPVCVTFPTSCYIKIFKTIQKFNHITIYYNINLHVFSFLSANSNAKFTGSAI